MEDAKPKFQKVHENLTKKFEDWFTSSLNLESDV